MVSGPSPSSANDAPLELAAAFYQRNRAIGLPPSFLTKVVGSLHAVSVGPSRRAEDLVCVTVDPSVRPAVTIDEKDGCGGKRYEHGLIPSAA